TIANAMDVGNPSNFIRIMELHNHSWEKIKTEIKGYSFNDKKTKQCISDVYNRYNYLLDPHGAVAYLGLLEYMKTENVNGIFFETAHPAKFKEIVEKQIPIKINMPKRLEKCLSKNKKTIKIENSLNELKKILINR
ncbi:MAG: threonine synthase, partial [Bacteroidales bacterium]|nr:threonine synthase [Bacteroidales bacterium]